MITLHRPDKILNPPLLSSGLLPADYCFNISSPATYEVDNFYSIAVVETRLGPLSPAHDLVVQLNRNARLRQRQFAYQIIQRTLIRNVATFSIDLNAQEPIRVFVSSRVRRQNNSSQLRCFAILFGLNQNRRAPSFERRQRQ